MAHQDTARSFRPRLIGEVRQSGQSVHIGGVEVATPELVPGELARILRRFDGANELDAIIADERSLSAADAAELVQSLDEVGIIDDLAPVECRSGLEVILEIEELIECHCASTIYENIF